MADELEIQSFNFGIQDTMEMGMGNAELIQDLISPETQTSSPEEITKIVKEITPPVEEKKVPENKEEEKIDGAKLIETLLSEEGGGEEGTTTEETSIAPEENTEEGEDTSKFSALSTDLFNLGVFNKEDGEDDVKITTPEAFLERFQNEKKKGAIEIVNNFIGQFGEDYQDAFQAIFVKGVDPKEYFSSYNNISNFSDMDLTKEENQVAVMKQALHDQGFESEDIDAEVERIKNYGDLESVSTKHHKVLVKKEALKLQQLEEKAEQELQQKAALRQKYISNVQGIIQEKMKDKSFDGIPLNPKLANEVQDFLLVDKYKTPSGETLTDFDKEILELKRPENHAKKVKLALLLKIMEKDPSLSTIQKTGVSKASDKLFTEVARQKEKSPAPINKKEPPTRWFT